MRPLGWIRRIDNMTVYSTNNKRIFILNTEPLPDCNILLGNRLRPIRSKRVYFRGEEYKILSQSTNEITLDFGKSLIYKGKKLIAEEKLIVWLYGERAEVITATREMPVIKGLNKVKIVLPSGNLLELYRDKFFRETRRWRFIK